MIDWNLTKIKFNRTDLSGRRPVIVVVCDECGKIGQKKIYKKSDLVDNQIKWLCKKCECNTQEYKNKISISTKQKWKNEEYRAKATKANKEKWDNKLRNKISEQIKNRNNHDILSKAAKLRWQDDEYRNKTSDTIRKFMVEKWKNKEYANKRSTQSREIWKNEEYKNKQIKISKQLWQNEQYRNKVSKSLKDQSQLISERCKKIWNNEYLIQEARNKSNSTWQKEEYLSKAKEHTLNLWKNNYYKNKQKTTHESIEYKEKMSQNSKENWKNEEYRNNIVFKIKEKWKDKKYQELMASYRSKQPRTSSIQNILYSILDDLNIKYYREYNEKDNDKETVIGPYNFDCVVPLNNKKLLIECQGDYWHSLDKNKANDKSKATYIEKYHPDCEIKYLWEHEFKCKNKIAELIKYWTNIYDMELIDYSFNNIEIKECPAKDYKLLLSKYHYLPNAGRGGIAYGAYLNKELIAVCVFSPLGRQNMPWNEQSTRELSRLCVHPKYQKKNFASWFVSRCIKSLNPKYKTIISYCDTTFNHDGAVYKACNFKLDGKIKPDYWYVSEDGWVMHKKTLYNHAISMSMKERDYAETNGYKKVYGKEKLRFVYERI